MYQATLETHSDVTTGNTSLTQVTRERRSVREVRASGEIVLNVATEHVECESIGSTGVLSYDSALDATPQDLFGRMLEALVGTSYDVVLTPDGEVKHVEGMERVYAEVAKATEEEQAKGQVVRRLLRKAYSNEATARVQRQSLIAFPAHGLGIGDHWTRTFEFALPIGGSIAGETRYELVRLEEHDGRRIAIIAMRGELRNPTSVENTSFDIRSSKVSGEMRFDVDRGVLRYSRHEVELNLVITARSRTLPVRTTSKTTIELVE